VGFGVRAGCAGDLKIEEVVIHSSVTYKVENFSPLIIAIRIN
jgi:hypothetical protein